MIENLETIGFKKDFINKMIEILGYDTTLNLSANYDLVKQNIDLMKNYNILNIEEIILYNPDIFFIKTPELLNKISKMNLTMYSKLVSEDFTTIDEILEEK